jgi:plasmid stability protein
MGELNIKGIDEAVLEGLAEMAKAHDRSVEAEAAELLKTATERRRHNLALLREAERISAMTPEGRVQADSTLSIREDRDHGH